MILNRFLPSSKDTWAWRLATLDDRQDILTLVVAHFQKEIDGVPFMPVVKSTPSQTNTQTVHFMRKDSLEKVK
jgi:hypothetical protein